MLERCGFIISINIDIKRALYETNKDFLCLCVMGCMVMGTGVVASAHIHDFQVQGKVLYNVKASSSHSYVSGYNTDPLTGVKTPVYDTCYTAIYQYRGVFTCTDCQATNGYYYYPDETRHSAYGQ